MPAAKTRTLAPSTPPASERAIKGARPRKEDTITAKIFVGNLNFETVESELEELFSAVGDVIEVFLPADRNTGKPRGFAFVEFADADAVPDAIEKFDGYELKGRQLRVNEAEARPPRPSRPSFSPRPPGGGGGGGGGGGYQGRNKPKPKGSRRKLRGKKRSL